MKAELRRPLIIGVTGGMASGKSTLARMLAGRGIAHMDADKLVHQLMNHDVGAIAAIGAAFPHAVNKDRINRGALAADIIKHPETLSILEAILHPRVRALEEGAIAFARRNRLRALVLDIPLLFETDADRLCDVVLVAHAPLRHGRARAFARAGMTEAKWSRLLDRQLPEHVRNALADVVISTAIGKAATRRRIQALMRGWGLL
ncbi:MAG: dephospho-CoA kinase [Rickettsiales bacterium]|nr:dephospho-CoA kinase [Rickettsiales bacterium]